MNNEGVPCPKRGRWKNKDQKWSSNTLNTSISNPAYIGTRIFNRHPQSHLSGPTKDKWFNNPSDWIIKKNAHPAIISEELFDLVNHSRKPYTRTNRFYYESPYLLNGLLKCKRCNFNFQGQTRKLKSQATNREYTISYYQDSGYHNKGNAVCKSYLLRKDELEDYIIKKIKTFISDDQFLNKVLFSIESKLQNNSSNDSLLTQYGQQIELNKKALQKFIKLINDGVELQEVKDEVHRINKEIEYLQRKSEEIKNKEINKKDIKKLFEKIKYMVDNFECTFSSAPLYIQKNIIRQFISEIIVDPIEHIIHCVFRKVPWVENELSKMKIYGFEVIEQQVDYRIKAGRKSKHVCNSLSKVS